MRNLPLIFFCECHITKHLWKNLQRFLRPSLSLPELNLKNVLLGYVPSVNTPESRQTVTLINHIILIFKRSLYEMRSSRPCTSVFYIINRIKKIEYKIAQVNDKLSFHLEKWEPLSNLFQWESAPKHQHAPGCYGEAWCSPSKMKTYMLLRGLCNTEVGRLLISFCHWTFYTGLTKVFIHIMPRRYM